MKRRARHRGLTLIETAIVFPIVILLTLGVLEYSWMFLKAQQISNAARHGARVGARIDATAANVESAVRTLMGNAGFGAGDYTITITPAGFTGLFPGGTLRVSVDVTYANVDLGMPLVPTPSNLVFSTAMAREGEEVSE